MYSFDNLPEQPSGSKYLTYGDNEVRIKAVDYITAEDGSWEAVDIKIEKLNNPDSVLSKRYFNPKADTAWATLAEQIERQTKQFGHFFEAALSKDVLTSIKANTFKELVEQFKALAVGKALRVKIVAKRNQENYLDLPNYEQGWARPINGTPFTLSVKEQAMVELGLKIKADKRALRDANPEDAPVKDSADDLPF